MAKSTISKGEVSGLFKRAELLLGRTPDDPELQGFLKKLQMWPVPAFEEDELTVYLENKALGFCLVFDDSSTVKHESAAGKTPGTPLFVTTFLYAEGVEGYHKFPGELPNGIAWSDSAAAVVAKLGPPKREIKNKRDGRLTAHAWPFGSWWMTVGYIGGGTSIDRIDLNIF